MLLWPTNPCCFRCVSLAHGLGVGVAGCGSEFVCASGAVKAKIVESRKKFGWLTSGATMAMLGSLTAGVSYAAGVVLKDFFGDV